MRIHPDGLGKMMNRCIDLAGLQASKTQPHLRGQEVWKQLERVLIRLGRAMIILQVARQTSQVEVELPVVRRSRYGLAVGLDSLEQVPTAQALLAALKPLLGARLSLGVAELVREWRLGREFRRSLQQVQLIPRGVGE